MNTRVLVLGLGLMALAACGPMYVRIAPPPNRVEVMSPQPGEIYVWVQGYWIWSDQVYLWSPGRWVQAPRAGAIWVPGEWRSTPKGYYWLPGRWQDERSGKESR